MHIVRCAAAAACVVAVLVGCTSTAPGPAAPGPSAPETALQSRLRAEVTGAGAVSHMETLQRIADENGGDRATPSPGFDASVDYVARVLREAGYEVSTPTFTMQQSDGGETTARNVIAQTRTGDPEHVVLAGAHLDSVPKGPGINDNGSGVAALLEIATRLGGSPPVTNAVRFGFFGAEEANLEGSTGYVTTLSERGRTAIALYVNVDMLASPNVGYFVQDSDGGRFARSGSPGSAAVGRVLIDELARTGVTAELGGLDGGGSDYVPFVEAEIPSAAVLAGDAKTKTGKQARQWGGRAGEVFDHCYHRACDRLDNVDRTALDRFTHAIAGTLAHFAGATGRPAR